jgi:lipopolysaccharide export system protein LptA
VKLGAMIALVTVCALPALGWAQATGPRPAPGAGTPTRPADGAARPADGAARPTDGAARPVEGKSDGKKSEGKQPVTVDSDRMERYGKESLIIFTGNVVARHDNSVQYADRMEVYLDEKGDKIIRSISTGNVRIVTKDCKTGTAGRAEYFDLEQRVVLLGNARVWQDDNVVSGDTITIHLAQDRNIATGGKQDRVKAVFYSKSDNTNNKPPGGQPPCAN